MNWIKRITQVRLTDEPYPTAEYECTECGYVWDDTEDPTCNCEPNNDESDDYETSEINDPPICIDCNDQDEQVWDDYNHKWKCKRCAFPGELQEDNDQ